MSEPPTHRCPVCGWLFSAALYRSPHRTPSHDTSEPDCTGVGQLPRRIEDVDDEEQT